MEYIKRTATGADMEYIMLGTNCSEPHGMQKHYTGLSEGKSPA